MRWIFSKKWIKWLFIGLGGVIVIGVWIFMFFNSDYIIQKIETYKIQQEEDKKRKKVKQEMHRISQECESKDLVFYCPPTWPLPDSCRCAKEEETRMFREKLCIKECKEKNKEKKFQFTNVDDYCSAMCNGAERIVSER